MFLVVLCNQFVKKSCSILLRKAYTSYWLGMFSFEVPLSFLLFYFLSYFFFKLFYSLYTIIFQINPQFYYSWFYVFRPINQSFSYSNIIFYKTMNKYLILATSITILLAAFSLYEPSQKTKMINKINSTPNVAWKAGQNSYFQGRSIQDIMGLMGTLQTPQHLKLPTKKVTPLNAIPQNFDSRQQWSNCESIKQVRDQSTCGSCWAFGAVQAFSDRICIASGQKQQTRISAEDLVSCCGISCGMGCGGGWPHAAWTHIKNGGLSTGWLYNTSNWCKPYSFAPCDHHTTGKFEPCGAIKPTPKCQKSCATGYPTEYKKDLHYAKEIYSISKNVTQIQTQILTNGPVEASFDVYEDFLTYKAGIYHHVTGKNLGGHSIKILGWGVQSGTPYWLVANSWNEDWGEKGFFRIKRGENECGIESSIVAGIPKMY